MIGVDLASGSDESTVTCAGPHGVLAGEMLWMGGMGGVVRRRSLVRVLRVPSASVMVIAFVRHATRWETVCFEVGGAWYRLRWWLRRRYDIVALVVILTVLAALLWGRWP